MSQLIESLVADAVRDIEERQGVSIELDVPSGGVHTSRGVHVSSLDRTTGAPGSGASALLDLLGVADRYGFDLSLSALEAHPKLIANYREVGFLVSGVADDDATQNKWLLRHRDDWERADEDGEQLESVHMHRPTRGYVRKAAAGLAQWLRNDGNETMLQSSIDSIVRSYRLPSRDELLSLPTHERTVVMSTILDRVSAAYTLVEPEALAAVTAAEIEGDENLGWFVACLNGMAAKDEQVSGPKM